MKNAAVHTMINLLKKPENVRPLFVVFVLNYKGKLQDEISRFHGKYRVSSREAPAQK